MVLLIRRRNPPAVALNCGTGHGSSGPGFQPGNQCQGGGGAGGGGAAKPGGSGLPKIPKRVRPQTDAQKAIAARSAMTQAAYKQTAYSGVVHGLHGKQINLDSLNAKVKADAAKTRESPNDYQHFKTKAATFEAGPPRNAKEQSLLDQAKAKGAQAVVHEFTPMVNMKPGFRKGTMEYTIGDKIAVTVAQSGASNPKQPGRSLPDNPTHYGIYHERPGYSHKQSEEGHYFESTAHKSAQEYVSRMAANDARDSRDYKLVKNPDSYNFAENSYKYDKNGIVTFRILTESKGTGLSATPFPSLARGPAFRLVALSDTAETVTYEGPICQAMKFPKHGFELSKDELRQAVERFQGPVPIDLEHMSTIFDGKLGHLHEIKLGPDGTELHGRVTMPKWVKDGLGDRPINVSTLWHPTEKTLHKLSLVITGAAPKARIMAALSAEGRGNIRQNSDECSARPSTPKAKGPIMSLIDKLKQLINGEEADVELSDAESLVISTVADHERLRQSARPEVPAPAAPARPLEPDPQLVALKARNDALEAENRAIKLAAIKDQTDAFLAAETLAGRIVPAEHDDIRADYMQAAADDAERPVLLADNKPYSRVEALRKRIGARTPHSLTTEQAAGSTGHVALSRTPDQPDPNAEPTAQRLAELLAYTSNGQATVTK